MAALKALHRALTVRNALVLVISPSQRQSSELLLKVKEAIRAMPVPPMLVKDNALSLEFENGSRIISLPANEGTIRGFSSVSLLIEDEAADVPDEIHTAVRPMLAVSGGQMIIMGTPKGRQGHFFEAWERGGEAWYRVKATGYEISRYAPGFLEQEKEDFFRRGLGDYFRQEYECEFVNAAAGRVYAGFDEGRNCIEDVPHRATDEWTYLLGLDFGVKDENAATVLGWRAHDTCVYVIESYRISAIPSEMAAEVQKLEARYRFERIVGDVGGLGKAFAEEARRRFQLPIEAAEKHNKLGFISLMNGDLREGKIKVVKRACRDLTSEWIELPWAEGAKKEADGFNNHAADSALYAWRACNAYFEKAQRIVTRGSPEWNAREQEKILADDLERIERQRNMDWWEVY